MPPTNNGPLTHSSEIDASLGIKKNYNGCLLEFLTEKFKIQIFTFSTIKLSIKKKKQNKIQYLINSMNHSMNLTRLALSLK